MCIVVGCALPFWRFMYVTNLIVPITCIYTHLHFAFHRRAALSSCSPLTLATFAE
jgi:hypothetical protein